VSEKKVYKSFFCTFYNVLDHIIKIIVYTSNSVHFYRLEEGDLFISLFLHNGK